MAVGSCVAAMARAGLVGFSVRSWLGFRLWREGRLSFLSRQGAVDDALHFSDGVVVGVGDCPKPRDVMNSRKVFAVEIIFGGKLEKCFFDGGCQGRR